MHTIQDLRSNGAFRFFPPITRGLDEGTGPWDLRRRRDPGAFDNQRVDGKSIRSEAAKFLRQYPVDFAVVAEVVGPYLRKHFPCVGT